MNVTKPFFIICFVFSIYVFGQKPPYPRDTIYIMYKDTILYEGKLKAKSSHIFKGNKGIKFWWKGKWMFYNEKQNPDTLGMKHLEEYHFSDMTEIQKKVQDWVEKKYTGQKYKPYPWSRNSVFHTYLIEIITEEQFVIYPVIWRNEGAIE